MVGFMENKKPTIGRIVRFTNNQNGERAAIVAHVFSDECVNLCVIEPDGTTTSATSVTLGEGTYRWNWPTIG